MIMRHAGRDHASRNPPRSPVAFCRLFDGSTLKTCKSKPRKQRQRHDQSVVWVYFTGDEYATGALCRAASVSGLSKKSMQCIAFHCRFGRKRGVRPWAQQLSPARGDPQADGLVSSGAASVQPNGITRSRALDVNIHFPHPGGNTIALEMQNPLAIAIIGQTYAPPYLEPEYFLSRPSCLFQ